MRLSSRAANPVGVAFVLCSANRVSAPDIVRALRPYLTSLEQGMVVYEDENGDEQQVSDWDALLRVIAYGTENQKEADFAADAVAAGCVAAHEILNVEVVQPHIQAQLHRGIAAVALTSPHTF